MQRRLSLLLSLIVAAPSACSSSADGTSTDAQAASETGFVSDSVAETESETDARSDSDAAEVDPNACFPFGAPGECMTTADCAAIPDHSSYSGYCPGPADVQCCIKTPNVADNPPVPAGWKLMNQADVTPEMTDWAVAILHDPTTYPMFSTTTRLFGTLNVMARVEWHPPDFLNSVVHRGVTLYEPA